MAKPKKTLQDHSSEELRAKAKTIRAVLYTIGTLILLIMGYTIYIMASGQWASHHMAGVAGFSSLGAVAASTAASLGSIQGELKRRGEA